MRFMTVSEARANLYRVVDTVNDNHEPSLIMSKRGNAVLLSEEDWKAIQETLYLIAIPGMHESIKQGIETPDDACSEEPGW